MKKIVLLLLLAFTANSCSPDDSSNDVQVYYELIPIQRCEMPYRFNSGETYDFTMHFKMPTTCHYYKGIYFEGSGTTKTIAIQSVVFEKPDCVAYDDDPSNVQPENNVTAKYKFTAGAPGTVYTFKIWSGKDEQGADTYYDVTIPVTN